MNHNPSLVNNIRSLPSVKSVINIAEQELYKLTGLVISIDLNLNEDETKYFEHKRKLLLKNLVCEMFDVEWEDIIGIKRHENIVLARHAYCYLCYNVLNMTKSAIAREIKKDHTTILNAILVITGYKDVNAWQIKKVMEIKNILIKNDDKATDDTTADASLA